MAETLQEYAAAGVDEFVVPDFNFRSLEAGTATLDLLMAEVVPALRS